MSSTCDPSQLSVHNVIVTTSTEYGTLRTAVNRYRRPSGAGLDPSKPGIVLFFAHGIGLHKEMWEPTISRLFQLDSQYSSHIVEAWAVDGQNHGDSAILNEKLFHEKPHSPIYDCAEVFATLYRSYLESFDNKLHKVVMVGHSGGGVIAVLSTSYFSGRPSAATLPYSTLILIEPAMAAHHMIGKETDVYNIIKEMTPKRRDIWESKERAREWMGKRLPWAGWDQRILDIYVNYGLRPLPTLLYPTKTGGVTLKTTKYAEAQGFDAITNEALDALHRLNQISRVLPTHLIFGEREELYSEEAQNSLNSPKEKRVIKSVSRILDTGHLIPQEAPDKLAECIYGILTGNNAYLTSSELSDMGNAGVGKSKL